MSAYDPRRVSPTNRASKFRIALRSQREVGRILGVTRQDIQALEAIALWKLRRGLRRFGYQ